MMKTWFLLALWFCAICGFHLSRTSRNEQAPRPAYSTISDGETPYGNYGDNYFFCQDYYDSIVPDPVYGCYLLPDGSCNCDGNIYPPGLLSEDPRQNYDVYNGWNDHQAAETGSADFLTEDDARAYHAPGDIGSVEFPGHYDEYQGHPTAGDSMGYKDVEYGNYINMYDGYQDHLKNADAHAIQTHQDVSSLGYPAPDSGCVEQATQNDANSDYGRQGHLSQDGAPVYQQVHVDYISPDGGCVYHLTPSDDHQNNQSKQNVVPQGDPEYKSNQGSVYDNTKTISGSNENVISAGNSGNNTVPEKQPEFKNDNELDLTANQNLTQSSIVNGVSNDNKTRV